MTWATVEQLREEAADLEVDLVGGDDRLERLLRRAQGNVETYALQARVPDATALSEPQREALATAACRQALWIVQLEDDYLGPDGIAGLPAGLSFSRDPRPRLSPAALEAVALHGLVQRSGTVLTPATE